MPEKNLDYYLYRFANLRIDRSHGKPAPHKAILLLSTIELIERHSISINEIELTPEIVSTFLNYWNALYPSQKGIVSLPFFHLKSDGFWHLLPNEGYEKSFNLLRQIRSNYQIRDMVKYAYLDNELFQLLSLDKNRTMFRRVIINEYFDPEDRKRLLQVINLSREAMKYEHLLIAEASAPYMAKKPKEKIRFKEKVREVGFRHVIMSIYNYTCSVCNMRILTLEGASVVEAAHIMPFSVSSNNDIRNGIALCKLHHWSFDEGLISIDENYCVMTTPLLSAQRPTEWLLTELMNKRIMLPQNEALYPAQEALHFHRNNIFLK
jgi:putative restriction endonuclease